MSELPRQLPAQPLRAEFADVEQMCDAVRSWDLDFSVLAAPKGLRRVAAIDQRRYGSSEISYARFLASIEQRGAAPRQAYTFGVLGAQMRRLWWRGYDVDSGTVIVFPVGSELHSISGPDFEVTTISVVEETVAAICERFGVVLPPARLRAETFVRRHGGSRRCGKDLCKLRHAVGTAGHLEARASGGTTGMRLAGACGPTRSGRSTVDAQQGPGDPALSGAPREAGLAGAVRRRALRDRRSRRANAAIRLQRAIWSHARGLSEGAPPRRGAAKATPGGRDERDGRRYRRRARLLAPWPFRGGLSPRLFRGALRDTPTCAEPITGARLVVAFSLDLPVGDAFPRRWFGTVCRHSRTQRRYAR